MNMIEVSHVTVVRGRRPILRDISLHVEQGTCCAVVGPNGSGKSTLLSLLAGYTWPSAGKVAIAGHLFGRVNLADVRRQIGLIEPSRMPGFSNRVRLRELIATGFFGSVMLPISTPVSPDQWRRVDTEIRAMGLAGRKRDVFGSLSTGERMKALIARAMVSGASILLLDEPTVGLDIGARAAFMSTLEDLVTRPQSPTVVIVSHHLDELPRNVDTVVLMKEGSIFDTGRPDEILTSEKLSRLYDCHVHVFQRNGRYAATARIEGA